MKKIALLSLCLLAVMWLTGCQHSTAPAVTTGPEMTFEQFRMALQKNDFQTAWDLLSEEARKEFTKDGQPSFEKFRELLSREFQDQGKKQGVLSAKVLEVTITARVKVEYWEGNSTRTDEVPMIKEKGKWKISVK